MKEKLFKYLGAALAIIMTTTTLVLAQDSSTKNENVDNVAPNSSLSATVIHPKKLDIVLMTDYTGTKESNLLTDVNNTINSLFGKNVDAKLITEDTTNKLHAGDTYFQQPYDGAPADTGTGETYYNGTKTTRVDIQPVKETYKRLISSGFGYFIWYNDDSVYFQWNTSDVFNMVGEAPPGGGTLYDAPKNIKEIGASKHALYILTTDGNLYMSGSATQMSGSYANSVFYHAASAYTGMRIAMTNVKDIKTNYNGIAVLKNDGTVYYAGNVGLVTQYDTYGQPVYQSSMNVSTTSSSTQYMSAYESYCVTNGFVNVGMSNITRIQLGTESVIGMNDNTGQVYGIGYNQGQFGWTDPYFMPWTGPYNYGKYTVVSELNAVNIPLLDSRKIKQIYMYGVYSKIIQTDNSIWQLKGGGFTTHSSWQYMYAFCQNYLSSIEPGSYTQTGTMKPTDFFSIDTTPSFNLTTTSGYSTTDKVFTGYTWIYDHTDHYDYSINTGTSVTANTDGTAYRATDSSISKGYYFPGITPVYSLNTNDVTNQNFRANADKILLYVSDNTGTDFSASNFGSYYPLTSLNHSFMSFLSTNNFGNYIVTPSSMLDYINTDVTSNNNQDVSLRILSNSTEDGHLYNAGNYAQALTDILNKYTNNKEALNKYVVANEDIVQYNTQMIDKENDTKKAERWRYVHDPTVFLNDTGTLATSGQWVSSPITTFSQTGEYKISYQTQDDPTNETNFNNYDYWSNQTDQLDIFVHRRPFAKFSAITPRSTTKINDFLTNFDDKNDIAVTYNTYCNIQSNGYGGSKALNGNSAGTTGQDAAASVTINVPSNASNAILKYNATGNSNYNITLDGMPSTKSSDYTSIVSIPLSSGTHTLTLLTYYTAPYRTGPKGDREDHPAIYGNFVLDNLELTYNTTTWTNGSESDYTGSPLQTSVKYSDTSYDLDHTQTSDINNALSSLPDKGIQAEEWKWIDTTAGANGTWQSGRPTTVLKDHFYQVSLRVEDLEGAWSDPYIVTIGDMPSVNNAPIANFKLDTTEMIAGATNNINEAAPNNDYDPDGDPIVEKHWWIMTLDSNGNVTNTQDFGATKPDLSLLSEGNYQLEKKVRDDPSARDSSLISLWSQPCIVTFKVDSPLTLAATLAPNPTKQGQTVTFDIKTTGYANNLSIFLPDELKPLDTINTMGYFTQAITPQAVSEDFVPYVVPMNTPMTIDRDGNRLRPPYVFNVRADNAKGNYKIVQVELDVTGNIYDGIKTEMK